ncbi:tRNA 2-thiouridine synthesizing protein C [Atopomonas hussainii]|uniref:tRNA 2-thiouridine synthesizing protein C n=1 Tax=Atopomonas hussainii TaxID=1429083 RepID=A0A1H7R8T3_9GAMM|nr:sulfurtransferase complex subunit TusC [Atopomonas hussainii]SEL56603.1 tRNA 2-thiouridine synthesizing protein C [Atopomonas hussainii]
MSKSLLLVSRHAPCSGSTPRELLDIALAGGAFDLPISLLFLDDGVFQLFTPNFAALEQKNLSANLQALPMFGVEQLYVAERCLRDRGLDSTKAQPAVQCLDDAAISALYASHDLVITL